MPIPGTNESFNSVFKDGCLDREEFQDLRDARHQIDNFRRMYNEERPHGALNGRTPVQFAIESRAAFAVMTAKAA